MTRPIDHNHDPADQFRHDLGLYLLGHLAPQDIPPLEDHLQRCPACRTELRRLAPLPAALGELDQAGRQALLRTSDTIAPLTPEPALRQELAALGVDAVALFQVDADGQPITRQARPAGSPATTPPEDLLQRILTAASRDPANPPSANRPRPTGFDPPNAAAAARPEENATIPLHHRRTGRALSWAALTVAAAAAALGIVAVQHEARPTPQQATVALAPPASGYRPFSGRLVLTPISGGSRVDLRIDGAVPGTRCRLLLLTRSGSRQPVTSWVADRSGRTQLTANTALTPDAVPGAVVETTDHRILLQGTVRSG